MVSILKTIYLIAHICMVDQPLECKDIVFKKEDSTLGDCYQNLPGALKTMKKDNDGWDLVSFECTSRHSTKL